MSNSRYEELNKTVSEANKAIGNFESRLDIVKGNLEIAKQDVGGFLSKATTIKNNIKHMRGVAEIVNLEEFTHSKVTLKKQLEGLGQAREYVAKCFSDITGITESIKLFKKLKQAALDELKEYGQIRELPLKEQNGGAG